MFIDSLLEGDKERESERDYRIRDGAKEKARDNEVVEAGLKFGVWLGIKSRSE